MSKVRSVRYEFSAEGADGRGIDERPIEQLLHRARERGIVLEYDTGRGRSIWFVGRPGEALRAVRRDVAALIATGIVRAIRTNRTRTRYPEIRCSNSNGQ